MSLRINRVPAIPNKINLRYPEDGSVLSGTVTAHFCFVSQAKLDQLQADVSDGKITPAQQFKQLVPKIEGIAADDGTPLEGEAAHNWLETDDLGGLVKSAIFSEYLAAYTEARAKNSKTSRSR